MEDIQGLVELITGGGVLGIAGLLVVMFVRGDIVSAKHLSRQQEIYDGQMSLLMDKIDTIINGVLEGQTRLSSSVDEASEQLARLTQEWVETKTLIRSSLEQMATRHGTGPLRAPVDGD